MIFSMACAWHDHDLKHKKQIPEIFKGCLVESGWPLSHEQPYLLKKFWHMYPMMCFLIWCVFSTWCMQAWWTNELFEWVSSRFYWGSWEIINLILCFTYNVINVQSAQENPQPVKYWTFLKMHEAEWRYSIAQTKDHVTEMRPWFILFIYNGTQNIY